MRWLTNINARFKKFARPARRQVEQYPDKPWDPDRTFRALKVLAVVVLVAVVVAGYRPAQRMLSVYVSQQRAQVIRPDMVRFQQVPAWMPVTFRQRMQKLVADQMGHDPLDRRGCLLAVRALMNSGWVQQVDCVQRRAQGVEVNAVFRQPAAFVREGEGYRLIDQQAVRLPGLYQAQHLQMIRLPVITGAKGGARQGETWPDAGVKAALQLSGALVNQPYYKQIRTFDVSQRDALGRLRMTLLTGQGQVVWGLPMGQEGHVEPAADLKARMLLEVYRRQGSIDAGGAIVEVFGPAPFIRLAEAAPAA